MIATRNNGFGHPLFINIPRIKVPIPIFILFRALNIISDEEICEIIILNHECKLMKQMLYSLKASIINSNKYLTQEECLVYITSQAMYTPINMEKEEGQRKKREFTVKVLNKFA